MNMHPNPAQFATTAQGAPAASIEVEQSIIGLALVRPDLFATIRDRVRPADFAEPIHVRIWDVMIGIADGGRTASRESVAAAMGDDEIAPNVTTRDYLRRMGAEAIVGGMFPVADAVETLIDHSQRRRLAGVGSMVGSMAVAGRSVADIVADAVAELDEIGAATRAGKMRVYDGAGAIDAALAHMDGTEGSYPTTGLAELDRYLGGWPRGQMSVLAGRPGMGKSAAACSSLAKAARKGFASLFFSLEMTKEQIGARLATDLAFTQMNPIRYEDILQRRVSGDDRARSRIDEARRLISGWPMQIEEQRGLTMAEIAARSRKHAAALDRHGQRLDAVFVDHIGLVRASSRYAGNRVREVAEISDGLATLAKELDCAVIALCQLNRGVEGRDNKRPSLADLRDSGAIEEDASTVTFVFRPAYYLENRKEDDPARESDRIAALESCRNSLEFVVAKNRNGRCGVVQAWCDIGANAIRDLAYGGGR